jgi:hypothetical protein
MWLFDWLCKPAKEEEYILDGEVFAYKDSGSVLRDRLIFIASLIIVAIIVGIVTWHLMDDNQNQIHLFEKDESKYTILEGLSNVVIKESNIAHNYTPIPPSRAIITIYKDPLNPDKIVLHIDIVDCTIDYKFEHLKELVPKGD